MALGIGDTGILAKVEQAIAKLIPTQISLFARNHPDIAVEALEFDVFGFSRSAAAARHFVHEIKRDHASPLLPVVQATGVKRVPTFVAQHDFRVNFVGLFDTVVAHASQADGFDVRRQGTDPIKVALPEGCARKVVQLVARDEHRANFMLTTVSPPHQEIALPGAHSDLGGGYRDDHEGPLMLIKPIRSLEAPIERDGNHYMPLPEQTEAWRQADTLRQLWKLHLGAIDDDHLRVDGWVRMEGQTARHAGAQRIRQPVAYATLRLDRPIDWRYQLIPLRVMHRHAVAAGVAFGSIDDDDPNYSLPTELQPIADQLLAGQALSHAQENLLARRYLHQSANWNLSSFQRSTGPELIYFNRPDPSAKRSVLGNQNK
ncbi:DUF2235 domain-containing protein [Dyella sp. M7H15-1]|uniref:phospholipase effector Tle1 domain-containing protein n=1 Tax=Dyella sp. M7H15-1 TaxID=2501295 RepID=UPI0013E8C82E|nr:DUF2235 domain-containing protein [Dyella sp. M7H15-1]